MNLLFLFLSVWSSIGNAFNPMFFLLNSPPSGTTVLLLHFDDGNFVTTFTDSSAKGHNATSQSISFSYETTSQQKFGSGSALFLGTGSNPGGATIPNTNDFNFGSGDFTVEFWLNQAANQQAAIISKRASSTIFAPFLIWSDGSNNIQFYASSNGSSFDIANAASCGTMQNFVWHSYAVSRQGNKIYCYEDGVLKSTTTSTATLNSNSDILTMGSDANNTNNYNGYMDELRITKGLGRYGSGGYTPATSAFTN